MRWVKWILIAVAGYIAYLTYKRVQGNNATNKPSASTDGPNLARQPGLIGNLKDAVSGFFDFGNSPAAPPIAGSYGAVGVTDNKNLESMTSVTAQGYTAVGADARVPEFLQGASGGVVDGAMTGIAPPRVAGPPPAAGSGGYMSPSPAYSTATYKILASRVAAPLVNLDKLNPTGASLLEPKYRVVTGPPPIQYNS